MNNYIEGNKKAWEEAFAQSTNDFTKRTIQLLQNSPKKFFTTSLHDLLVVEGKKNGKLGQFCCNNGRETLASLSLGFSSVVGFDIAKNMIDFANNMANKMSLDATFVETNILEMDDTYHGSFDTALLTVGAISWFENLEVLFASIAKTIKLGGILIIEELHPVENMLATKGDENFDEAHPTLLVNDYFKKTPWVEQGGMGYMTDSDSGKETFTSYTQPLMNIINALIRSGFEVMYFEENDVDQSSMFTSLDHQGLPLTFLLKAKKVK